MPSNLLFYFPKSPQILTDELFILYGGQVGTSSPAQRRVAYQTAEYLVADYLNTFLKPTAVTGTFVRSAIHPLQTDFMFVQSVEQVILYSVDRSQSCTLTTNSSSCVYLRDARRGILDLDPYGSCGCNLVPNMYQVEVAYTAGIPSGTLYNSPAMVALALIAQDELDEIMGISPTPGGIGIIEWENQEYREKLAAMKQTEFGSTPRAQRATRLLSSFVEYRYVGL